MEKEKIKWLQQMVVQSPSDPQAHYWLGIELAENDRYHEAISSISMAISYCTDEKVKTEMVNELIKISSNLKQEEITAPAKPSSDSQMIPETDRHSSSLNKTKPFQPNLKVIDGNAMPPKVKQEHEAVKFEDVAGLEDLKKTIHLRIISPFFNKGYLLSSEKRLVAAFCFMDHQGVAKHLLHGQLRVNVTPIFTQYGLPIFWIPISG